MGFGYLTIGYLTASLLYLTAQALGVGSLASIAGYALMFYGLSTLHRYHKAFLPARFLALACAVLSVYDVIVDAAELFLFDLPILQEPIQLAMHWSGFCTEILLLLATLWAVRALSTLVGLGSLSAAALRDMIFVGLYAVLYLLCNLPLFVSARSYLVLSMQLCQLAVIVFVLLLFLQCTKNICPAGDEEVTPRRSRFSFVNRLTDAYDRTHERMTEQARADGAEFQRRREEKKRQRELRKKNKHK